MNIAQIPLPAVGRKLLITAALINETCQRITREIGQYRYTDALDVMCAVNQLDDVIEILISDGISAKEIKQGCSIALSILANNYNHILTSEDREGVVDEYESCGYSVKYCEKGGLFIPLLDEPIPHILLA